MSAFVNPEEHAPLSVPCLCPPLASGEPRHDQDTVMLRTRLHYGDLQAISRAGSILGIWDNEAATLRLMEVGIVSWTFVDDSGNPVDPSREMIQRLDPGIARAIQLEMEKRHSEAQERMSLPNGSSGRSEPSSPAITPEPAPRRTRRKNAPSKRG